MLYLPVFKEGVCIENLLLHQEGSHFFQILQFTACMFPFVHMEGEFDSTSRDEIHTLIQFDGIKAKSGRMPLLAPGTGFLLAKQHFRCAEIFKRLEECIQVVVRAEVQQEAFQRITVFHGVKNRLVDACHLKIADKVIEMFLEECAQSFGVIPLVKQTIEYIV